MQQTTARPLNGAKAQSPIQHLIDAAVRRDRKARREKLVDHIAWHVGLFLGALLSGWAFMLAVGVVHHEWIRQCPTIGYGWAVLVAALWRSALAIPAPQRHRT